jgi:hypothetical protein
VRCLIIAQVNVKTNFTTLSHQQEEPGYFTGYSEADYSVYDRVKGFRLPTGA